MTDPSTESPGLRVAMFMPGLRPDALGWHVHLDFARQVEALGPQFQVLTTGQSSGSTEPHEGGMRILGAPLGWEGLGALSAPLLRTRRVLPAAAALARYLRAQGSSVDVLHVEVAYPHGTAAALARRMSGWSGPIVLTPMGEDTLVLEQSSYGFRRYPVPRRLIEWTLREAAVLRCISPMLEERLSQLAPRSTRRMIPLNVASDAVAASTETEVLHHRRRVEARAFVDDRCGTAGRPIVLALGRLHPFKGLDVLVRAMASVPDAALVIVGPSLNVRPDGDVAARLLELARELDVSDRVQWVGATPPEQALDWLAGADAVAVPSRLESLNKVCVEAAAVGTPFVVTETTGISAWVQANSGVGIVVPPGEPAALAVALTDIVGGVWKADRNRLAAFVDPFRPEIVANQLVELYRDVIGGHA
jgi:glycosyltransferase involved in cell wall biosynthesis